MAELKWDNPGERYYETGVKNCILYVQDAEGNYPKGVAWNGITAIKQSPSGAESTPLYADDTKYLNLISNEEFSATIEAYTYPDEFAECDGTAELAEGIKLGQQPRKQFGLCYLTTLGNDLKKNDYGYKLHLVYGCTAAPSEKGYATINDSPEAITFSWEVSTTPVDVPGFKPTAHIEIDSTKVKPEDLAKIKAKLWGSASEEATLPLPNEIKTLITAAG